MNLRKTFILTTIILFISGCSDFYMICSLNPFYLDKNIIMEPRVEGDWMAVPVHLKPGSEKKEDNPVWNLADTTSLWKIERVVTKQTVKSAQGKDSTVLNALDRYMVKLIGSRPDSSEYEFRMVLFSINKTLYADFTPAGNTAMDKSRFATESYFTVHTLARVVLENRQIEFSWLGADYMKEMIEKKRVRVSYRWVSSAKRLLLTGTSEQLTAMIEHYAGEPRFIDWESQQAILKLNKVNH